MNVFQAIAAVAKDVGAVGKDNRSQGYSYRGIDDVINALHGPLAKHGVVIVPHVVEHTEEPADYGKGGWKLTTMIVEYHVYGPEADAVPTPVRAVGTGLDNSDKGPGKAMSYAYKAAISQLFSLPTDDVRMDNEHPDHVEEYAPPPPQAPEGWDSQKAHDGFRAQVKAVFENDKDALQVWKTLWKGHAWPVPFTAAEALVAALEEREDVQPAIVGPLVAALHPNQKPFETTEQTEAA